MNRTGWLAFAGGASLGMVAGRYLPPLLAQGLAAMGNQDPFEPFVRDHRRFLHLLNEMEASRGRSMVHRGQLLARLKRGLAAHAVAEEDVIYPLLIEEAEADVAARRLYAEHGMIKTHLYALERSLADEDAWLSRAAALRALVADHARLEEEVEFPRLRLALDTGETARMARHLRREKAMIV